MQTPPKTPGDSPEGRSEGPKRARLNSTGSNASEDGAIFLGKAPPRATTPQPTDWEAEQWNQPERQSRGLKRSYGARKNSNTSEDGAVFMGRNISRPNSSRPRDRRRASPIDVQQHLPGDKEEAAPRSPLERFIYWVDGRFVEGLWTERERKRLWQGVAQTLVIVLAFVVVQNRSCPECAPSDAVALRRDVGEPMLRADVGDTAWLPAHQSLPLVVPGENIVPVGAAYNGDAVGTPAHLPALNTPTTPRSSIAGPGPSGVLASQIWTFNPKALAYVVSAYISSNVPSMISGATSWAKGYVGKVAINKGSEMLASEPDIHGWDTVLASQENRAGILSALKNVDEVSAPLYVQLGSQVFANQSADASDNLKRIKTLEALQTQLEELKTHQFEIVKTLDLYHRAASLASSALEDHLLFGRSKPEAINSLNTLRSSMLETASTLIDHTNAAEQNIASITKTAEGLPWKTQKSSSWLGRWVDGYRYRGIGGAFTRLEHLSTYFNVVRGLVTSDVLALQ